MLRLRHNKYRYDNDPPSSARRRRTLQPWKHSLRRRRTSTAAAPSSNHQLPNRPELAHRSLKQSLSEIPYDIVVVTGLLSLSIVVLVMSVVCCRKQPSGAKAKNWKTRYVKALKRHGGSLESLNERVSQNLKGTVREYTHDARGEIDTSDSESGRRGVRTHERA